MYKTFFRCSFVQMFVYFYSCGKNLCTENIKGYKAKKQRYFYCINFIILIVSANEPYPDYSIVKVDSNYKSVMVALKVKNNPIVW